MCKNISIYVRNSIYVFVCEFYLSKKESLVFVYKLIVRIEEIIFNFIIWNVFDEFRMGVFVMDWNNFVFK